MHKMIIAAALLATSISVQAAADLIEVYHQAVTHDPTFQQAVHTYHAAQEALPQATAATLPNIAASGNVTHNDYSSVNRSNQLFGGKDKYKQWGYGLTLNQPIFNAQLWLNLKQASYTVKQAQAVFDDATQALILRTATAYFAVLQAKDNLRFANAQLAANGRSLEQARQRYNVGLEAIASVYEAQAAYDASRALVITANNNLQNQYEKLSLLTTHTYTSIAPLRAKHVPLVKPAPFKATEWVNKALHQNFNLKATQFAVLAAKSNLSVKHAGHLPTVNVSASINKNVSDSHLPPLAATTTNKSLTLALNVPLFQGGSVVSQARQAYQDYQRSLQAHEQAYRSTEVNTRIAFNTIRDGISTIKADRQAVKSARNSLDSTSAQFKVGTRTMVDVVTSQKNLYQAQTQLAKDQYNYILALLQLKYLAGSLSVMDLQAINRWLHHAAAPQG